MHVPQPLIAALHGYVLGSGMEIALYCDLRIASEDVVFGLPEVGLESCRLRAARRLCPGFWVWPRLWICC